MTSSVFTPLPLPCGAQLPNRLAKAAMEENMAIDDHLPGDAIFRLYETWAKGGVGLIITGNVMVYHGAMTGPGGIALEQNTPLEPFKKWAKAAQYQTSQVWMQINHPGRQVYAAMGGKVLSPSDIPLDLGKHSKLFGQPKAMNEAEIADLIERFTITAKRAIEAGFNGIQIHAAHGYLLSQFLSPLTNKRTDQWGGSLENRARLLIDIVKSVRAAVPSTTAISVKLNSADFQRGGFDASDALAVVKMLDGLSVDLVELSGGSYESPAMQGQTADGRTLEREAYFLEFAKDIAQQASMPIMTTGGIVRLSVAETVLKNNVAMVGMASALAFNPNLPKQWQTKPELAAFIPRVTWKDKTMAGVATMAVIKRQLQRMGKGKPPKAKVSAIFSLIAGQLKQNKQTKKYVAKYSRR